ncbi:REP-associated tyrosine transposase [Oceanisphaera sp. W20_SRM_FM3]|uniref:REP-associated tyrosine transposase n=1 Tax=Oceanisphaera sp. W20_SRM_FM3 TaxID=3240267 RepID=UPI003F9988BA
MSRDNLLLGRYSMPNTAYHITVCTDQRRPIFADIYYARLAINELKSIHDANFVSSLAWVLMPDHLHWLFVLRNPLELSEVIKLLKGRTARQLNLAMNRQGSIWQKGFFDHALRHEEEIKPIARYIVANPLRKGLVERIEDYPHWDAIWL